MIFENAIKIEKPLAKLINKKGGTQITNINNEKGLSLQML